MESLAKYKAKTDEDGADPMQSLPSNRFTEHILKSVIGEARAN